MKYTKEALIESLQQYYKEFGKNPTTTICSSTKYLAGKGTYASHFGSFGKALEAAGLKANKKKSKVLSDEELLNTLREYFNKEDKIPSQSICNSSDILASHTTYTRRFGSFTAALKKAGISLNHNHTTSSDVELLDSIKKFIDETGRAPTSKDFTNVDYLFSRTTYYTRFGSMENLYNTVGYSKITNEYSDSGETEELLTNIRDFYIEHGRAPVQEDCKNIEYLAAYGTYYYRFGSLRKAVQLAGVPENEANCSSSELDIRKFIKSVYNGRIVTSDRGVLEGLEIDILLPDLNLGFEYNGLYWHSYKKKQDKLYHINKTKKAKKAGITLIHIFESDWTYKKEIVKSRINNLLGGSEKIYARKCIIKEVVSAEARLFMDKTHLQGSVGSSVKLGLYYKNELVSLMTFGKSRYTNTEWELLRFSNKLNISVIGGASRLFKYFINNYKPKSIVSYADLRWSTGNLYNILGLEFKHSSAPNYWYFTRDKLESRIKYQKHKLDSILPVFDKTLTEWENMSNNGYNKIYDCGNAVFTWTC